MEKKQCPKCDGTGITRLQIYHMGKGKTTTEISCMMCNGDGYVFPDPECIACESDDIAHVGGIRICKTCGKNQSNTN